MSKYRLLIMLTLVYALNRMDYTVISIVLPAIKDEYQLSDSQIGLLTGIGFSLFYSVMSIPLSRWADHGNRARLVSISTTLFSLMAMASGMAASFGQLLVARIGVAIGEAGTLPAAQSFLGEHFGRAGRVMANAVLYAGASLGVAGGFFLGGWLNDVVGWRWALILIGAPGVIVGGLFYLLCRGSETRFEERTDAAVNGLVKDLRLACTIFTNSSSVSKEAHDVWRTKSYRGYVLGSLSVAVGVSTLFVWVPSFFFRTHGIGGAQLGLWMAAIFGGAGVLGVLTGGLVAGKFAGGNERLQLRTASVLFVVFFLLAAAVFAVQSPMASLVCLFLAIFVQSLCAPVLASFLLSVVVDRQRAFAAAMLLLLMNLVAGVGPLLAGVVSDLATGLFQENSLRFSILSTTPFFLLGAYFFWQTSNTAAQDIASAENNSATDDQSPANAEILSVDAQC